MKTMNPTIIAQAPGQGLANRAAQWLAAPNRFVSTLLGVSVSRLVAMQSVVASLSFSAALCLLSLSEPAFGWAAFFGLLSLHCIAPLFNLIKED